MNSYTVTYGNGAQIVVELPGSHVPAHLVIAAAEESDQYAKADPSPVIPAYITRDAGTPAELVVWRRLDADRSERTVELPEEPDPEPFRLFVSFTYESGQYTDGTPIMQYGNTIVDMEFEPCEPEHIDSLQAQIATYISSHRVVILGWQRLSKPAKS